MSAFWDWSVAAYARPGAADALLALQDRHGQNIPLLLWVVWRRRNARPPDPATLAQAAETARRWEGLVSGPLRTVRRTLTGGPPGVGETDRLAFRARVQAVELDGERVLMESLAVLEPQPGRGGAEDVLLAEAAAAYGAPLDASEFNGLLARL